MEKEEPEEQYIIKLSLGKETEPLDIGMDNELTVSKFLVSSRGVIRSIVQGNMSINRAKEIVNARNNARNKEGK